MRLKQYRKLQILFCMLGMVLWMLAGALHCNVSAAENIGSLTIFCQTNDGIILSDAHWEIYRIGRRAADGSLELEGKFAEYPVSLADTSKSAISDAAKTLASYTVSDRITPLAEDVTDAQGKARFASLEYGLYLLVGGMVKHENVSYLYSPFIMEVPAPDTKDVDIIAYPKSSFMSWTDDGYLYTLRKIWKNDENQPELRSASITAKIFRDGELYETVVLDESNDWTYEWFVTDMYDWHVIEEDVPDGYTVVYTSNGLQYAIVNTYSDQQEETTTQPTETTQTTTTVTDTTPAESSAFTSTTVTETTTATSKTTTTQNTTAATTKTTTKTETLPQTGQLWWPVPLLAAAGVICMAIGLKLRTKE